LERIRKEDIQEVLIMNKIILLGRLTKDPELRTIDTGDKTYTKFIIAVERNFKSVDGERKSDFIPVILWGKKAEVVCRYLKKGNFISLSGRLRTGSYDDKDGNKKYVAEVVAEDFKFVGGTKENGFEADNSEKVQG
jgi:single-strand DNA-binding protein